MLKRSDRRLIDAAAHVKIPDPAWLVESGGDWAFMGTRASFSRPAGRGSALINTLLGLTLYCSGPRQRLAAAYRGA
jgi:hypothetical protein